MIIKIAKDIVFIITNNNDDNIYIFTYTAIANAGVKITKNLDFENSRMDEFLKLKPMNWNKL